MGVAREVTELLEFAEHGEIGGGTELGERIEAAAMGVAREVTELLEFAEHGEIGGGTESAFECGQIGDAVAAQVPTEHRRIKGSESHNVRVPTVVSFSHEL